MYNIKLRGEEEVYNDVGGNFGEKTTKIYRKKVRRRKKKNSKNKENF